MIGCPSCGTAMSGPAPASCSERHRHAAVLVAPSLSVLVASKGRPSLAVTTESIVRQLEPRDELLVDVNNDAPWGHAARNRMMPRAKGDVLLFLDDDDHYVDGALSLVRAAHSASPNHLHVFQMRYVDGRVLWRRPRLEVGNVSTQMITVPRRFVYVEDSAEPEVPASMWGNAYEGDWDFIRGLRATGLNSIFHRDVIAVAGLAPDVRRPG